MTITQRPPQELFASSSSSVPTTPTRRQPHHDHHDTSSSWSASHRAALTHKNALGTLTMTTTTAANEILDESFGTATTEATTHISELSSPMHHSPFSWMGTPSADVSAEFLETEWNDDDDELPNAPLFTRSASCTVPSSGTGATLLESEAEFRGPSPSYESSSSRPRAKRRTRQQQTVITLEDLVTPIGISERRRSFRQSSVFADKGMVLVTPTSSSEGRSSPDVDYDSSKPVTTTRRPRRSFMRPKVFISESELLLRQPLAQIQITTRRLRSNGVMGMLCLVGLCFMGMIFVTNRVFFLFEEPRFPGLSNRQKGWTRRRTTTFQPDSLLVNGGLRGVVSYATSWKEQPGNTNVLSPVPKIKTKETQRLLLDKHKSKTVARHNSVTHKKKPLGKSWPQKLEGKPSLAILAEVEAERSVAHGLGIVIPPPPKLWITRKANFDLLDPHMYRQVSEEIKPSSVAPRVLFLDGSWTSTGVTSPRIEEYPAEFTDNTQLYSTLDSSDERLQHMELREPLVQGECVPMQDWQTTFYPSCNGMHELGMENMGEEDVYHVELFGTKGYWRNAWKVESQSTFSETRSRDTFVVKTLKFQHDFEEAHFEHSRIDAVAMERLTASPHVINIFGFCGHSVLTEYADGKRVGELADKMKKAPLARLRIARDIANGLADVHGIDGDGNATFVHLDVNLANVVSIGDTLKLNDFNIGIFRRWNTTSNTPCGFPAQFPNPQWRSPEEARNEQNLTEKVDVFSMGHIFFRLICGHEPWNKLEVGGKPSKEVITEKVQKGVLPFILPEVMTTTDKEVAAIRDAMLQCYTFDPTKRPSARDIAKQLDRVLSALSQQQARVVR